MADVIAMSKIVADVITTEADVIAFLIYGGGRCYCQVADVIATAGWVMVL